MKPGINADKRTLCLLDVVPDGEVRFGFPNINDNAEIAELIAARLAESSSFRTARVH